MSYICKIRDFVTLYLSIIAVVTGWVVHIINTLIEYCVYSVISTDFVCGEHNLGGSE